MRGRRVQVSVTADELERWRRAAAVLQRVTGMLDAYQRAGMTMTSIEDVRDLLGQDPDAPPPAQKGPPPNPLADKMTECDWPGAPGTSPPGWEDRC